MVEKSKRDLALEYFDNAYNLHIEGKINEAIKAYKASIKQLPTAKAHTFLGWAYSLLGEYEEAINQCKVAIGLNPNFGNPYNDIGSYLISLERHDEAIEWLEKAILAREYESRHYPYYNLGMIYEKKGDWFRAMFYYKEALKILPEYEVAQSALLRLTTLLN